MLLHKVPNKLETEFIKYKTCIENEMHNIPFENNKSRAKGILEIVHSDVFGIFQTAGLKGKKYFVSFIDDYSKITKVY